MKPKKPETLEQFVIGKLCDGDYSEKHTVYSHSGVREILKELRRRVRKLKVGELNNYDAHHNFALERVCDLLRWK